MGLDGLTLMCGRLTVHYSILQIWQEPAYSSLKIHEDKDANARTSKQVHSL